MPMKQRFTRQYSRLCILRHPGCWNYDGDKNESEHAKPVSGRHSGRGLSRTVSRNRSQLSQSRPGSLDILRRLRVGQEEIGCHRKWMRLRRAKGLGYQYSILVPLDLVFSFSGFDQYGTRSIPQDGSQMHFVLLGGMLLLMR